MIIILVIALLVMLVIGYWGVIGRPGNRRRLKVPVWCPDCSPALSDPEHGVTGRVEATVIRNRHKKSVKKIKCGNCGRKF